MGVSVRQAGVILLFVLALVPRTTLAAPLVGGALGTDCGIASSLNCGLFDMDPVSGTLAGEFQLDNDVALFRFILGTGPYTFTAASTSAGTGFDPILTLFGPGGTPVPYIDADGGPQQALARNPDIDGDVAFPLLTLTTPGTYILSVSQFGVVENVPIAVNFLGGSLADGFIGDAFPCFIDDPCEPGAPSLFDGRGQTGAFSLSLTVTPPTPPDPTPVPEPGSLSLVALGAAAAALERRRRARHTNTH